MDKELCNRIAEVIITDHIPTPKKLEKLFADNPRNTHIADHYSTQIALKRMSLNQAVDRACHDIKGDNR